MNEDKHLQIFVHHVKSLLDGGTIMKTISIETSSGTTIKELKRLIQDKTDIPFDEQQIIFSGKCMNDDEKIGFKSYNGNFILRVDKTI